MVMWFNVKEARNFLLNNGFVYTLRSKPYRLRSKKTCGLDILSYNGFGKKGLVYFVFVKRIRENKELKDFVKYSGFNSIEKWLNEAKENRCLYYVVLIDKILDKSKKIDKQNKKIIEIFKNKLKPLKLDDKLYLKTTNSENKFLGLSTITNKKTVIYIDKNSLEFCAEIVLHELSEIAIFNAIKKISDSDNLDLKHKRETDNISHWLNAYSLNQYNAEKQNPKLVNPFKNYIESDRLPLIQLLDIFLNPKLLNRAYADKHKGFSVFHKTDKK